MVPVPIIETQELTRCFGPKTAVNHLSLAVKTSEIFGLLGPNGAGKTTLIKMLTTLLPPSSGTARVAGMDILHDSSKVRRMIGYVPQLISADGTLSGRENLLIFSKLYDIPARERNERIADSLAFMGLTDSANQLVREYSGGMIRRLEIAQSMLHRPRVLFLDEPTIGLDPVARNSVWEHIGKLRNEFGTTIFFTTHLMEEADALCDRVGIMSLGHMAALGSPGELKAALGTEDATLEDVFIHFSGDTLEQGGGYRAAAAERKIARRLG